MSSRLGLRHRWSYITLLDFFVFVTEEIDVVGFGIQLIQINLMKNLFL